jgi:hypothetical protein
MAEKPICEAVAKQASITLGISNNGYETVRRCVFKLRNAEKFLSPVGSRI